MISKVLFVAIFFVYISSGYGSSAGEFPYTLNYFADNGTANVTINSITQFNFTANSTNPVTKPAGLNTNNETLEITETETSSGNTYNLTISLKNNNGALPVGDFADSGIQFTATLSPWLHCSISIYWDGDLLSTDNCDDVSTNHMINVVRLATSNDPDELLVKIDVENTPFTTQQLTTSPLTTKELTTQPLSTQPLTTQPLTTQPLTTQPLTTQPLSTSPLTTKDITTQPLSTQPLTTSPLTTKDITTQPLSTQPLTTQPLSTSPLTTKDITTQPLTTQPLTTSPLSTQEYSTQALTTEGLTTEPLTTQPMTTQPMTTQPLTTQELTTEPLTTQPLSTQPITSNEMTTQEMTSQQLTTAPLGSTTAVRTTIQLTMSGLSSEYVEASFVQSIKDAIGDQSVTVIASLSSTKRDFNVDFYLLGEDAETKTLSLLSDFENNNPNVAAIPFTAVSSFNQTIVVPPFTTQPFTTQQTTITSGVVFTTANPGSVIAPPSSKSGLSTGEKVAIGVIIPVGVIVIIVFIILIVRLNRRRKTRGNDEEKGVQMKKVKPASKAAAKKQEESSSVASSSSSSSSSESGSDSESVTNDTSSKQSGSDSSSSSDSESSSSASSKSSGSSRSSRSSSRSSR